MKGKIIMGIQGSIVSKPSRTLQDRSDFLWPRSRARVLTFIHSHTLGQDQAITFALSLTSSLSVQDLGQWDMKENMFTKVQSH